MSIAFKDEGTLQYIMTQVKPLNLGLHKCNYIYSEQLPKLLKLLTPVSLVIDTITSSSTYRILLTYVLNVFLFNSIKICIEA